MRLTPVQQRAFVLIQDGGFYFDRKTGGAKRTNSRYRIARRTLNALLAKGLVEYSAVFYGLIREKTR